MISKIYRKLVSNFVFDRQIGFKRTFILASMGRSGSTMLENVINNDNSFRVMFGPFRAGKVKAANNFDYPTYINPDYVSNKYKEQTSRILLGKIYSNWVNKDNKRIFAKYRLIKDIRVNLFLSWIQNNFSDTKIILLIRHPGSVINSWQRANWGNGDEARNRLLNNSMFIKDVDKKLILAYQEAQSEFEKLMFLWCFSYYFPLTQLDCKKIHIVFYENLVLSPKLEIFKLFKFLNIKYNEKSALKVFSKPSSMTDKTKDYFINNSKNIDCWKNSFTDAEIVRAQEILRLFGMENIYCKKTSMLSEHYLNLFISSNFYAK